MTAGGAVTEGRMSVAEREAFVSGNVLSRVSCHDSDGWPYGFPCWHEYRDGGFYLVPRGKAKWATFIQKDPRVALCIDTLDGPRRVTVKGRAKIVEEPNVGGKWVEIAESMATRYLGPDGPTYLKPTLHEPRWLIFVEPLEWLTWQGNAWPESQKTKAW